MAPVSYNWRVLRWDGRPMTAVEVAAVMLYFQDHRDAPNGYRIEAVNWAPLGKRKREPATRQEAEEAMVEHFWYTLHGRLTRVRVGSVKRA